MTTNKSTPEALIDYLLQVDPILDIWKDNFSKINEYISIQKNSKIQWLTREVLLSIIPQTSKAFLIVGAGSSLDSNLSLIKLKRNNFIIVCTDAALPALIDIDVKPDIVVMVDPSDLISKFFTYRKYDTSDIPLIAPATSNIKTIKAWKGDVYLYSQKEYSNIYKQEVLESMLKHIPENTLRFTIRGFVGYMAVDMAYFLKAQRIIMVGMDFCFLNGNFYCESTLKAKFGKHWKTVASKKFKAFKNSGDYIYIDGSCNPDAICTSKSMHYYARVFHKYLPDEVRKISINCSHEFWSDIVNYSDFSDICRGLG